MPIGEWRDWDDDERSEGHYEGRRSDELLQNGWQDRLRHAINRHDTAGEEIQEHKRLLREAELHHNGILVAQGTFRDALLLTEAAKEHLDNKQTRTSNAISVATQSVEEAMTAAYGISAIYAPKQPLGSLVGYSTGQGKNMGRDTEIITSSTGTTARMLLDEKISRKTKGALVVTGAEDPSVYNQLLLSAIKDQSDRTVAPLSIILSQRADRAQELADFFGVERSFLRQGSPLYTLPADIRYETAQKVHHIDQQARATELLSAILNGEMRRGRGLRGPNVMVFLRDEDMCSAVVRKLCKEFQLEQGDFIRTNSHDIYVSTKRVPLTERARLELGDIQSRKPKIILSTQPAEMLGITEAFDVVIDTHRSDARGGYHSISPEEADRRASFTKPDGVCYRLTTHEEAEEPEYQSADQRTASYHLSPEETRTFNAALKTAQKDLRTFPRLSGQLEEEHFSDSTEKTTDIPSQRQKNVADTPIQQWEKTLAVPEHVAKLVDRFDQKDDRDLALLIAACLRETRFTQGGENSFSALKFAEAQGIPRSDLLVRLHAFAEMNGASNNLSGEFLDAQFNEGALKHVYAMVDRWGKGLNTNLDIHTLLTKVRELDTDTLSQLLIEIMPDRLYYAERGRSSSTELHSVFEDTNGHPSSMLLGKESISPHSGFSIVLTEGGRNNDYATTLHPISIELMERLFPDKVKIERSAPSIRKYRDEESVVQTIEHKLLVKNRNPFEKEKEKWIVVESDLKFLKGQEKEDAVAAIKGKEREKESAKKTQEELRASIEQKMVLPTSVLAMIIASLREKSIIAAANDNQNKLLKIQKLLASDVMKKQKQSPLEEIDADVNELLQKIESVAVQAAKAANPKAWSLSWYTDLKTAWDSIPQAFSTNDAAQRLLKQKGLSQDFFEKLAQQKLLKSGVSQAQQGKPIDLEKLIAQVIEGMK